MMDILKWLALIILLIVQIWGLLKQKEESKKRKNVKIFLNILLSSIIALFLYQPKWGKSSSEEKVLVYSGSTDSDYLKHLKDSLKLSKSISYSKFKSNFQKHLGSEVYFWGEEIEPEILSLWAGKPFYWFSEKDNFEWNSILRLGEKQKISGQVFADKSEILKVVFGGEVLDSLSLRKGYNFVNLSFPTFSKGRTEVTLLKDEKEIVKCRFFVKELKPFSILLLNENPDFESKNLAEWLGNNAYKVQSITQVSKSDIHSSEINLEKDFSPDLIITSSKFSIDKRVKKHLSDGRNVLFYSFENPEIEIKEINKNTGTRFELKSTSNEKEVVISSVLSAVPFKVNLKENQKLIGNGPSVYEQRFGKMGISLLNETFPVKLSGDSTQYGKIWLELLAAMAPVDSNLIRVESPIFKDIPVQVSVNNFSSKDEVSKIDSFNMRKSVLNSNQSYITRTFNHEGWVSLDGKNEVFVEKNSNQANLKHFVKNNSFSKIEKNLEFQSIPNWLWFVFILLALVLLWIEPKINY